MLIRRVQLEVAIAVGRVSARVLTQRQRARPHQDRRQSAAMFGRQREAGLGVDLGGQFEVRDGRPGLGAPASDGLLPPPRREHANLAFDARGGVVGLGIDHGAAKYRPPP